MRQPSDDLSRLLNESIKITDQLMTFVEVKKLPHGKRPFRSLDQPGLAWRLDWTESLVWY